MMGKFRRFSADKSGAVTVDYIVLGAALVGLIVTTMSAIRSGTFEAIADVVEEMDADSCVKTEGGAMTTDLSRCQ